MSTVPIIESIGLEIETDNLIRTGNNSGEFSEDHDASIETYKYTDPALSGMLLERPLTSRSKRVVSGTEFKSSILTFNNKEDIYPSIERFLYSLESRGECPESKKSGIHVHVCMPYSLNILKNAMNVAAHLEQVFMYLGGLGYTNRGVYNDFAFFRPITKCGPVVTTTGNGYGQCFNIKDLYESTSVKEFFYRYGGIDTGHIPGKYTPIRYHWITLYPLLTFGTMEYRVFNKTLNPMYLYSVIKFCQLVSKEMLGCTTNLPENSIFDPHSKTSVIDTMLSFVKSHSLHIDRSELDTLTNIIERTPSIRLEQNYVLTHLARGGSRVNSIFGSNYCTPSVPSSALKIPEVTTIHDLNPDNEPLLG